ncbi:MAG: ATP-binding cassette domain-containing protein, partial [Arenicellales bacterium]
MSERVWIDGVWRIVYNRRSERSFCAGQSTHDFTQVSALGAGMGETIAIDIQHVSKIFGAQSDQEVRALDDVSVAILQNEFFTLLGPSGCGKTTFLRCMADLEHP